MKRKACGRMMFCHDKLSSASTRGEEEEGSREGGGGGGGGGYEIIGRLAKDENGKRLMEGHEESTHWQSPVSMQIVGWSHALEHAGKLECNQSLG